MSAAEQEKKPALLNLGCGHRCHPEWTNVDQFATRPGVIPCDLRSGICFGNNCFDAVYHSNVLEHFTREQAKGFVSECLRVLKPGGVMRVVVPDLEGVVRAYLQALDEMDRNVPGARLNHEWMTIELLDQIVRTKPGGEMLSKLSDPNLPNRAFIEGRLGEDGRAEAPGNRPVVRLQKTGRQPSRLGQILQNPRLLREVVIKRLLGREYFSLQLGRFRAGGEVHQWMYDRESLKDLLVAVGFRNVKGVSYAESAIPGWMRYAIEPACEVLRMEAQKG